MNIASSWIYIASSENERKLKPRDRKFKYEYRKFRSKKTDQS